MTRPEYAGPNGPYLEYGISETASSHVHCEYVASLRFLKDLLYSIKAAGIVPDKKEVGVFLLHLLKSRFGLGAFVYCYCQAGPCAISFSCAAYVGAYFYDNVALRYGIIQEFSVELGFVDNRYHFREYQFIPLGLGSRTFMSLFSRWNCCSFRLDGSMGIIRRELLIAILSERDCMNFRMSL